MAIKKPIKIYLDDQTLRKLKHKASELGYEGRAWLSRYLEKLASESVLFLDSNVRALLEALDLKNSST